MNRRWTVALAGLLALAPACGRRPEAAAGAGEALETVEVTPQPDSEASLENEPVEVRRAAPSSGVAGALPESFPRDVPLPMPSSLVDFVAEAGHDPAVTLELQSAPETARRAYEAQLVAAGFERAGDGLWTRGARRVRVSVTDFAGAARITVRVVTGRG